MADDHALPPAEFRVLLALLDGVRHGHGIKLDVRARTDGRIDMGPGTLGLPLSWAMIPVVGTGVVGVEAFAPEVAVGLGGVTLLMVGVAFLSSWLPARRSSSVDPVRALTTE